MFTGIIEEIGRIKEFSASSLVIEAPFVLSDSKIGDSIAVNGICLTIEEIKGSTAVFHVSHTTLGRTALTNRHFHVSSEVNLERAVQPLTRLGGHLVSGHVDEVGKIIGIYRNSSDYDIEILFSKELSPYIINRGSVTVNGISLTVAERKTQSFVVTVIPHTFTSTTLKNARAYDPVNLEADMIARYVIDSEKYR